MPDLNVSVVIPTYNRAHLLGRAISSALSQFHPGDEVIVIDDESTDHTERVVAQFGDRVRYFRVANHGAGVARNRGIREARNPLVAFLDSDDEWMPNKLAVQRGFMAARPDILFTFTNFAYRSKAGEIDHFTLRNWLGEGESWDQLLGPGRPVSTVFTLPGTVPDFFFYEGDLYRRELLNNYIFTSTLVVRREEAGDALRFAEDLPTYEDWECFGLLARAGKAAFLDCEAAWQHAHGGERLTDADVLKTARTRLKIIERLWGQDDQFMAAHGAEYYRLHGELLRVVARELLRAGRPAEAREALRGALEAPLSYRLLSMLPGPVAKGAVAARRFLMPGR